MFEHIETFELKDLDGKTLKIIVNKQEDITVVFGHDIQDNKVYVLSESITR